MTRASRTTAQDSTPRWGRRTLWLLLALTLLRVAYLRFGPVDLSPDEAYYWDWSRRPDWCYYSKPPMVAWVIALSTAVFGDSTWAVRLPAALLGTLSLAGVYTLGSLLFSPRVGFWSVAVASASIGSSALGLIMTIDPPLMFAWIWALVFLWKAVQRDDATAWAAAGVLAALGALAKPSMLFFPLLAFLFLGLVCERRPLLLRVGPYLFLGITLLSFVPIVVWNRAHDWITFSHAGDHFTGRSDRPLFSLTTFFEFFGTQLAAVSPVTWILLAAVLVAATAQFKRVDERVRFLVVFSATPLAGILLLSLKQRVHGNWSAPFYWAGEVLVAAWAVGEVSFGDRLERLRTWFRPALWTGVFLAVVLYALPVILPRTPLGGGRLDPTVRARGWKELGARVGERIQRLPNPSGTLIIGSPRQLVSELAFYVPGTPTVYRFPELRVSSQYEIWGGPRNAEGRDCLLIDEQEREPPAELFDAFESVEALGSLAVPLGPSQSRVVHMYLGRRLKQWPQPALLASN